MLYRCFAVGLLVFSVGCNVANRPSDDAESPVPVESVASDAQPADEGALTSLPDDSEGGESIVAAVVSPQPEGYPNKISLKAVEALLRTLGNNHGQGCGVATWEETRCGFFVNEYGRIQTPWCDKPVLFSAGYAQMKKDGNFLICVWLESQEYCRDNRTERSLTWRRGSGP
jgi:hypothetical protein